MYYISSGIDYIHLFQYLSPFHDVVTRVLAKYDVYMSVHIEV